ncbi:MAG: AAA family ATPase [Candidatus Paceibacterota bacterium]|jgi:ATP-dependent exoDNAse (exonuclease V) alpha subunit
MTQKQALEILKTGANVFLTGEPGAGKTYTINEYVNFLRTNGVETAITASTGIAATHIGGMTIHSWSGIGIKRKFNKYDLDKIASIEYIVKRIRRTKVLIIDEVSMLSADTLSMVDAVCREVKQNSEAFGGLQIIFVGDFFQLPPIVKNVPNDEDFLQQEMFSEEKSKSNFAYDCSAWERAKPLVCYITEQYRQDDEDFLSILSAIRQNTFNKNHLQKIEKRKIDQVKTFPENIPKLFSHNIDVDFVNNETLSKIENRTVTFQMSSDGNEFLAAVLKKGCLSPENLILKVGAEVMFTKNSQKDGFVNGTLGTVIGFDQNDEHPIVKIKNNRNITVEPMEWVVEENGKIKAKIIQVPLRLAWAITVHKSQGMSMDGAIMDLSGVFEYGQGYVALSRVRRLSGLYIIGLNEKAFQVHPEVLFQDRRFRDESKEAERVFAKISSDEIKKMHENFVRASGGYVSDSKIKKSRKVHKVGDKKKTGGHGFDEIRKTFPNAFKPWSESDDKKLKKLFSEEVFFDEIAKEFGRKTGSIIARLQKFGLIE